MQESNYMEQALGLAEKGLGQVNPNPMVGAVLVKDNRVIGQGFHERYGGVHAERNAINDCSESLEGATLFVTLEPCCHIGKTPPCTEAIIKSGIKKVVVGSVDPNPLVSGKGIEILRKAGIEVTTGMMDKENRKMNRVFFHYMETKEPYVVMKYAMTTDGKIATVTGASRWITGEQAREHVHDERNRHAGIMVGIGTVLADDPLLNCRIPGGKDGIRIICDTHLKIPLTSRLVKTAKEIPLWIATGSRETEKIKRLEATGCRIMKVSLHEGQVDLNQLMKRLGEDKMDSILLEGGANLNYSALKSGIVKKVQVYVSPKMFGGETAKSPVGGAGVLKPEQGFMLVNREIHLLGEDLLLEYEVVNHVYGNC